MVICVGTTLEEADVSKGSWRLSSLRGCCVRKSVVVPFKPNSMIILPSPPWMLPWAPSRALWECLAFAVVSQHASSSYKQAGIALLQKMPNMLWICKHFLFSFELATSPLLPTSLLPVCLQHRQGTVFFICCMVLPVFIPAACRLLLWRNCVFSWHAFTCMFTGSSRQLWYGFRKLTKWTLWALIQFSSSWPRLTKPGTALFYRRDWGTTSVQSGLGGPRAYFIRGLLCRVCPHW